MGQVPWPQLALYGPTTILLALIFVFILSFVHKMRPTWEKIKLRELDVREAEAKSKEAEAASRSEQAGALKELAVGLGQLGSGNAQMAETLKDVAVEQRRATESVKILQRVNADTADQMARQMAIITDRVERIERDRGTHVESEGSGAKAH